MSYISSFFYQREEPKKPLVEEVAEEAKDETKKDSSPTDERRGQAYDRKPTLYDRFSKYSQILTELPVAAIAMLLFADLCNFFAQRGTVTWLYYIDLSEAYETQYVIDQLVSDFIFGIISFAAGLIADSYSGRYKMIMYGNYMSLGFAVLYLAFVVNGFTSLDSWQLRFSMYTSPIFTLMRGVRVAFLMEQIKLPQFEEALNTYTFFVVCVRNIGRSAGSLCYDGMRLITIVNLFLLFLIIIIFACITNTLLVYFAGKRAYHEPIYRGISFKVIHCLFYCLFKKLSSLRNDESISRKANWLDYGEDKFDIIVRTSCKIIIKIPILFIPLIFNAFMRGSLMVIWDIQQREVMRGYGFLPVTMKETYAYLCVLMLPIVHYVLKPLLRASDVLSGDVHYVSLGYFLTGLSVALSAVVQTLINVRVHEEQGVFRISKSLQNKSIAPIKHFLTNNSAEFKHMNFGNNNDAKWNISDSGTRSSFSNDGSYPKFLFALYPQLIIAVVGDCIMMPSLIGFTYKNSPPKLRATIPCLGFTSEAFGRGLMALIYGPFGVTSDFIHLKIWSSMFFTVYLVYLYLVLNVKFVKDEIDEF